jgi:arylsulfatase A-like enzyme
LFNGVYELRKVKQIEEILSPENKFKINLIRNSLVVAFVRNFGSKYPKSWIKTYDSAIQNTDDKLIKPLLDKIKSSQLEDNTIIIITADHGEAFGEHGIYGHGWNMFDEFIRVPLIIKVPRIEKGRKIRALVQGVDIMPTALELAGVVCPHQAQGKSLVNLMSKVNAAPVHEYIFSGGKKVEKTIRSLEWKLITGCTVASKKELYNLRLDPGEKNNIYDKNKDVALKLELKFKEWEASLPFYKDQEYSFSSEIDKATQEKIRKTGYW